MRFSHPVVSSVVIVGRVGAFPASVSCIAFHSMGAANLMVGIAKIDGFLVREIFYRYSVTPGRAGLRSRYGRGSWNVDVYIFICGLTASDQNKVSIGLNPRGGTRRRRRVSACGVLCVRCVCRVVVWPSGGEERSL